MRKKTCVRHVCVSEFGLETNMYVIELVVERDIRSTRQRRRILWMFTAYACVGSLLAPAKWPRERCTSRVEIT